MSGLRASGVNYAIHIIDDHDAKRTWCGRRREDITGAVTLAHWNGETLCKACEGGCAWAVEPTDTDPGICTRCAKPKRKGRSKR